MNEYETIDAAARRRDWQECARIMFGLLCANTIKRQRDVAKTVLNTYVEIWKEKHNDSLKQVPEHLLAINAKSKRPELPEFPEDLDPADAEFENGLIEFYNGAFFPTSHAQHTMHFATAIRCAVTARQVNAWLRSHPDDYATWKSGRGIDGPTFLDDEDAATEAQNAWKFVDDLLKEQPTITGRPLRSAKRIAQSSYQLWEDTIL